MLERRKFVRINEFLKIGYKVIGPLDIRNIHLSDNISGVGVRLPVNHRMTNGTMLDLAIYLAESSLPIPATGEVVWLANKKDQYFPYVVGIKFIKINPADQEKILNFIHKKFTSSSSSDINWID